MASKSRSRPARKKSGPNPLADLGLFEIPNVDMEINSDDDTDVDENMLESELEALMRGEISTKRDRSKPKPKVSEHLDLEKIAAECLKDDDDDDDDDDQNLSENEDLLKELQKISPEVSHTVLEDETPEVLKPPPTHHQETSQALVSILNERLALYNEAVSAAKSVNDNSKVRRYGRAVKTLESLLKSAKSGIAINEEDIPPVVSIPKISQPPARILENEPEYIKDSDNSEPKEKSSYDEKRPSVPPSLLDTETIVSSPTSSLLITRRDQYKIAALQAKKAGNKELAIKYMKIAKSFNAVIEAASNNQPVDLANIPPPPPSCRDSEISQTVSSVSSQKKMHEQVQTASPIEIAALAAAKEGNESEIFDAPQAPTNILEALQQRLEKYTTTKQAAEAEGNSGKVRRLQRIIKSYETAIKDYKANKPVDFDELPTPPGFAPIPFLKGSNETIMASTTPKPPEPKAIISTKPISSEAESNVPAARKPKIQRTNTSTADKQLEFLLERQKLFRQAALSAKQNGDVQQAKEYLRMSKGFDSMIEATKCGLPIDASTIPTPPQLESTDFEIIEASECVESDPLLHQDDLFETIQRDLCNQLEVCARNKEHFFQLGDVSSASKFEKLACETKKDLVVVQSLKKKGENAPKFHYETRLFSMVLCHTDLADNDIEVTVERGINLPGKPDDLDSYVKVTFPIPSETPQSQKTHTVKDTNNPVFEEKMKFEFSRKSRSHLRLFKRHSIKFEVYSRGGFLRSDTLLGIATVKMVDLESKCLIHDSYNLMDGRKACGGKLEVKIRLRDPLLVKQVEEVREKWLVIGS